MDKILDSALGLIEVLVLTGALGFGGYYGIRELHDITRREVIRALKEPTPSLSRFSKQLTAPSR